MNNDAFAFDVKEELHKIQADTNQGKISNISRISSAPSEKNKIEEIKRLIRNYAQHWGETEENIEEYINDQLEAFPLDDLISCFRLINADIQTFTMPLC